MELSKLERVGLALVPVSCVAALVYYKLAYPAYSTERLIALVIAGSPLLLVAGARIYALTAKAKPGE